MAVEIQHNTPEQVREYLLVASDIVDGLDLDDELKVPAFLKAVDLVASKQISYTQADMTPGVLPAMAIPRDRGH